MLNVKIEGLPLLCVVLGLIMAGCGEISKRFESKVNALGRTNEVVVIADQSVWSGMVGDTVDYYFGSPFPIMPQPEPMFDVRHYTTGDLYAEPLRKELRTYLILADLRDEESETTKLVKADLGEEKLRRFKEDPGYFSTVGRDKWATGQLLIYVFADGHEALSEHLVQAFPSIARRIQAHDASQVEAATYLEGQNGPLTNLIREKFGVILKIPGDYKKAIEEDNFLWIRKDTRELTSSIVLSKFPYNTAEQLTKENLIALRDSLGLAIGSGEPGSYMRTNAEDLPVYAYDSEVNGSFAREIRGIWEMEEDFLGGPFVSYAILSPDRNTFLLIDAFVYAPGVEKRDLIQQIEFIVHTAMFE